MITEEERKLVIDRLRELAQKIPKSEATSPFIHALGTSYSIQQMISEVEAGTIAGDEIVKAELKKLKYYRGL